MKDTALPQGDIGRVLSPVLPPAEPSLRIAYLVNLYPKVSHAFIRREILALESCGLRIERFSIRRPPEDLVDEADRAELKRTRVVLDAGFIRLFSAMVAVALSRPVRFARALALTLRIGWRSDRGLPRNFAYLAEASLLLGWLKGKGIQHVHAHFATNPAAVAMLCHALGGPRYSFMAHGPDDFDRGRYIGMEEKVARARFVVTESSFGRSQLYRLCHPRQWSKIHVLRLGVDDALLLHAPAPIPAAPRIVAVGRLHRDKGHLLLIEAVRQLIAEGVRCELVLVGDGPLRQEIEDRIALLRLDRHIRLAGAVGVADLCRCVQDARALVLPSLAENLPSVILEAFALGRPVIATMVAGIPELVESGACGWLIPAGSVEALVQAVREALDTPPEILERMAREGARRVAQEFRSTRVAEQLLELFQAGEF